jgi:hypothetical protein
MPGVMHGDTPPSGFPVVQQAPPPGWYQDPEHPWKERWWSGYQWTGHARQTQDTDTVSSSLLTWTFIMALVIPFVGFVLGIVVMAKGRGGTGFAAIMLSVLAFLIWSALLAGAATVGA